jgi:hypothetical protein
VAEKSPSLLQQLVRLAVDRAFKSQTIRRQRCDPHVRRALFHPLRSGFGREREQSVGRRLTVLR